MVLYEEHKNGSTKRTLRLPNKPPQLVLLILVVVLALVVAALLPTILVLLRDLLS